MSVLDVAADEVMESAVRHVTELPPKTDFYALLFDGKMNVDGEYFKPPSYRQASAAASMIARFDPMLIIY